MPEIRVADLSFGFGKKKILNNVSFVVQEGSVFLLTGPSGSGKSTLLRLIAGFLQPSEGEIYIGGKCVSSPGYALPPRKRGIGMVFQSLALWPHLSAAGHLRFASGKRNSQTLLERVGLEEYARRLPSSLSGGQKQRLAIARALASEPSILLCDEPFNNLDPPFRWEMNQVLAEVLKGTRKTVLLVTHNLEHIELPVAGCLLLEEGRIRGPGQVRELCELSGSKYARLFLELMDRKGRLSAM